MPTGHYSTARNHRTFNPSLAPLSRHVSPPHLALFPNIRIGGEAKEFDGASLSLFARRQLAQPVFALDLVLLETADARQRPSAVGHGHGNDDLVGARRIGNANFDGIEMAANESRVLVAERHV